MKTNLTLNNALVKVLKSKRLALGLSQKDLAEHLNVQQSFISKIESGERDLVFSEVFEICTVLNTEFSNFVDKVLTEFRSINEAKSKVQK